MKGFMKDGKFHPMTEHKGVSRKKRLSGVEQPSATTGVKINRSMHNESIRLKREKVKAELLTSMELYNHPFLEESTEWLRTFAENPKLAVADEKHDRFWIWFGGRMIHEFRPDGEQVDAFSVGGSKEESLTTKEVTREFERELNEK